MNLFSDNYEPNKHFDNLKIKKYRSPLTQLTFVEDVCENDINQFLKSDYLKSENEGYSEYSLIENIKSKIKKNKLVVSYDYSKSHKLGRVYAKDGVSIGGLRKQIRNTLTHSNYDDWDIKACHQSILIEICKNNRIELDNVKYYVDNREKCLLDVMKLYKCDKSQAKQLFCGLLYGQKVKSWIKMNNIQSKPFSNEIIKNYCNDVEKIATIIKDNNLELYEYFVEIEKSKSNNSKKTNPLYSNLSFFLQEKERIIIENVLRFIIKNKYVDIKQNQYNLIYCFDGLMLYKYNKKYQMLNGVEFKNTLEKFIKNELNINIEFENKQMEDIYDLGHITEQEIKIDIDYDKPFNPKYCEDAFAPLLKNPSKYYELKKDYLENGNLRLAQVGTSIVMNFNEHTTFMKKSDLNVFDCIYSGEVGDFKNKIPFLNKWNNDSDKAFYHSADFHPTRINEEAPTHIFNLFQGYNKFVSKTNKNINYELLKPFFELVKAQCENNDELMEFYLKWYATSVQSPREKIPISFIFVGNQGTGASTMTMLLQSIFKKENVIDSANIDDFFGSHSEGFFGKCHINMNEISLQKSYKYTESIKSAITEDRINVNPKCVRPFEINNFAKITFTTNNMDGVPIDVRTGDRRFVAYQRNAILNNTWDNIKWSYVRNLKNNEEFVNSLFWYLMSLDITNINWEKDRPITQLYNQITELNASPMVSFMEHIIKTGLYENEIKGVCKYDENEYDCDENECEYDWTKSKYYDKEVCIQSTNFYTIFKSYCNEFGFYKKEFPTIMKFSKILLDYSVINKKRTKTGINYIFTPKEVINYFEEKHFIN